MNKVLGILIVFSFQFALAQSPLVGDWCKKYDDFTEAYKITQNAQGDLLVRNYTVGNQSGEVHGSYHGYLSIGGNHMELYLKSVRSKGPLMAQGLIDYDVSSGNGIRGKRLKMIFDYGQPNLSLKPCKIHINKRSVKSLDELNSFY